MKIRNTIKGLSVIVEILNKNGINLIPEIETLDNPDTERIETFALDMALLLSGLDNDELQRVFEAITGLENDVYDLDADIIAEVFSEYFLLLQGKWLNRLIKLMKEICTTYMKLLETKASTATKQIMQAMNSIPLEEETT